MPPNVSVKSEKNQDSKLKDENLFTDITACSYEISDEKVLDTSEVITKHRFSPIEEAEHLGHMLVILQIDFYYGNKKEPQLHFRPHKLDLSEF